MSVGTHWDVLGLLGWHAGGGCPSARAGGHTPYRSGGLAVFSPLNEDSGYLSEHSALQTKLLNTSQG